MITRGKQKWVSAAAFTLIVGLQFACAVAGLQIGNYVRLYDGPGNVNAGEFIAKVSTDNINYSSEAFRTFCVQTNEYLSLGQTLKVVGISDVSKLGDQPLMAHTSALYREFMRGMALAAGTTTTLSIFGEDYQFNSTNMNYSLGGQLQQAIWHFQNQGSYASNEYASNKFVIAANSALSALGVTAGTKAVDLVGNAFGLYGGVKILNLMRGTNFATHAQDQLYYDGSLDFYREVPEPASIAMWGIGALGLMFARRKRAQSLIAG